MKTLFLLRHAKSSWNDIVISDFERPLNERGYKAAPFMGKLMNEKGFEPSIILSSPAIRARETASLVKEAGTLRGILHFEPRIYEASPQELFHIASAINDENESALMVGHNPGIEAFIRFLTGEIEPMPTAALAVIDLNIEHWNEMDGHCGSVSQLIRPKEIM